MIKGKKFKNTFLANTRIIKLVFKGSKSWVIFNMANIIINPLRNLTIDVLLIGLIYNAISKNKAFQDLIPIFIGIFIFYVLNVLFEATLIAYVNPIGNTQISKSINKMLMKNAANVPLSSYDDFQYYNEYIFSIRNYAETAKKAVENFASFVAYIIGNIMSIGLIVKIEPIMSIFIVFSIVFSYLIATKRSQTQVEYSENIAPINVKEKFIHKAFYLRDYTRELRCF